MPFTKRVHLTIYFENGESVFAGSYEGTKEELEEKITSLSESGEENPILKLNNIQKNIYSIPVNMLNKCLYIIEGDPHTHIVD